MKIESCIDHTILKAAARETEIVTLCDEAKKYGFASVCVNSSYIKLVSEQLAGTGVKSCCVTGFPLGAMGTESKFFETRNALKNGADEIDMVINVGALKDKKYGFVEKEIFLLKQECGEKILKVIIECCFLTDQEKVKACELAVNAGADFVKTSTGFGSGGANIDDVKLMKKTVGDKAKVKASGGIRDYLSAKAFVDAGADRIGTSSGIKIVKEQGESNNG